jgi:restriction system protein
VLDLLHAMGSGTSRSDLQRVGGSSDGIISLDRLGLEKVYIQAKRWKNTVGSPEIQGFMGALQLQSASKGVFITTSVFTKDAKLAAARARGTIVLIDGEQLAGLMMDHGVGVSHKALRVPKVDNDYFDEG